MTAGTALVAIDNEPAGLRFLEFFTVNIRNPNRRAIRSPSGKSLGCVVASPAHE